MEAGPLNKINVGFIIQARITSSRLPGKVLLPIPLNSGKPLIQYIIDEIRKTSYKGKTVIATSVNPNNDTLEDYCKSNAINFYRGDEENVLSRYIEVTVKEHFDVVVRLTGDNPVIDISLLDKTIQHHIQNGNDYTKSIGLPLGMNFEIISAPALLSLRTKKTSKDDKEHVGLYLRNNSEYKSEEFKLVATSKYDGIRLTVDYPSDYLVVAQVLAMSNALSLYGLAVVDKLLVEYPWIFEGNSKNIQKRQFVTVEEELQFALETLAQLEMNRVAGLLKKSAAQDSHPN